MLDLRIPAEPAGILEPLKFLGFTALYAVLPTDAQEVVPTGTPS